MFDRPLTKIREAYIGRLSSTEADEKFAPRVLKVVESERGRNNAEELYAMKQYVARSSPLDFPLLVWTLFDEADDLAQLPPSFDLSVSRKLEHLPQIIRGLRKLTSLAGDDPLICEQPLSALWENAEGHQQANSFQEAWDACRYGQRFECQAVSDLGDLQSLCVKDLLVMNGDHGDSVSRALVLLRNLIEGHNTHMQLLWGNPGSINSSGSINSVDTPGSVNSISLHQVDPDSITENLVPWRKARCWLEQNIVILPQSEPMRAAKDAEALLRGWLSQTLQLAEFSLDGWPQIASVPAGMVRLPADEQAVVLPPECILAIEDFFCEFGILRDKICLALEVFKKIALAVESAPHKISPETMLQDRISTCGCRLPPSPSLFDIFELRKGRKIVLRIKHLNALQDYLSDRIEAKAEDMLDLAYRTPLDEDQLSRLCFPQHCHHSRPKTLLKKLSILAEKLARDAYPPEHSTSPSPPSFPASLHCAMREWSALFVAFIAAFIASLMCS